MHKMCVCARARGWISRFQRVYSLQIKKIWWSESETLALIVLFKHTSQFNGGSYGSSIPVKPEKSQIRISLLRQTAKVNIKLEAFISDTIPTTYLLSFLPVQVCIGPLGPCFHTLQVAHPNTPIIATKRSDVITLIHLRGNNKRKRNHFSCTLDIRKTNAT